MKLDHCLFGYDDGHRLLASSLPLESESSLLTELSDLAPGTVFGRSEGYWTGIPAPVIGRYVLMRTWPAPEMARPGCVWTHALLIEPAFLELIKDLSVLRGLFSRPNKIVEPARYREKLLVDMPRFSEIPPEFDDSITRKLLAALYGGKDSSIEVNSPGELEGPLFAVWSQQWPRLRRNFRFQTAASQVGRSVGNARFDITATLKKRQTVRTPELDSNVKWLDVTARDVQAGADGLLRHFLWRYGEDVRRQRSSFQPLVETYAIILDPLPGDGLRLARLIGSAFSGADDAKRLKHDLVDGVLASTIQAELLHTLYLDGKQSCFPMLTDEGVLRLLDLWEEQSDLVLRLSELMLDASGAIAKSLLVAIARRVDAKKFWHQTDGYPLSRKQLLHLRPELLVTYKELELDTEILAEILPLVPRQTRELASLISRLVCLNDARLATSAFANFPCITAKQVVLAMGDVSIDDNSVWVSELIRRPEVLLRSEIMGSLSQSSSLFKLAESLGWLSSAVIAGGVSPWTSALKKVLNDLQSEQEDVLNSFLIALALESGGADGCEVVELLFDKIHRKILKSKLPSAARDILLPLLPELGWISSWDFGRRFRLAIAGAYVRYQWSTNSYAVLSSEWKVREMLASAALDISGGKQYYDALRGNKLT